MAKGDKVTKIEEAATGGSGQIPDPNWKPVDVEAEEAAAVERDQMAARIKELEAALEQSNEAGKAAIRLLQHTAAQLAKLSGDLFAKIGQ